MEGMNWVLHYYFQGVSLIVFALHRSAFAKDSLWPIDSIMAMVLPISLCPFRSRLQGNSELRYPVHPWSTLQAVRAVDGSVPGGEVSYAGFALRVNEPFILTISFDHFLVKSICLSHIKI
jgi:hypothetical protein